VHLRGNSRGKKARNYSRKSIGCFRKKRKRSGVRWHFIDSPSGHRFVLLINPSRNWRILRQNGQRSRSTATAVTVALAASSVSVISINRFEWWTFAGLRVPAWGFTDPDKCRGNLLKKANTDRFHSADVKMLRSLVQKSYVGRQVRYIHVCVCVCVYFVWNGFRSRSRNYPNYSHSISDNIIAFGSRINVYRITGMRFALGRCRLHVQLNPDYLVPDIFAVLRL